MTIKKAFKNPDFWLTYEKLYDDNNDGKDTEYWLSQFAEYFDVKNELVTHITPAEKVRDMHLNGLTVNKIENEFDPCKDDYTSLYDERFETFKAEFAALPENQIKYFKDDILEYEKTTVTFSFPLPVDYNLLLILDVDIKKHAIPEQTLVLSKDNKSFQLGYWDSVHWLPYCLLLEELNQLERYWQKQNSVWKEYPEIAWALLAKFIGIDKKKDLDFIDQKYHEVLKLLNIESTETFYLQNNCAWEKVNKNHEFICVNIPDYLKNLNVNAEGVKMMSYSLRKQNYGKVEDYKEFPFDDWKKVMENIR